MTVTDHIFTVHATDQTILAAISKLHLDGQPFHLDAAYSVGKMWDGLTGPRLKYDLHPQLPDVMKADCRQLPLEDGTIDSVAFDPPMSFGAHGTNHPLNTKTRGYSCSTAMNNRFTQFASFAELQDLYTRALDEFHRVLRPRGILAFKTMDFTDSKTTLVHVHVCNWAAERGFEAVDLLIKVRRSGKVYNPNKIQKHARKEHVFWIVFKKNSNRNPGPVIPGTSERT